MQLNQEMDNQQDDDSPTWLAYASTIWTLRSLWTLSHTKRRYDSDDITPTPKEQLILLTDELLLASLKLQGRLSNEETATITVDGNRFGIFMGIESIYQILDRLSKELLYYQDLEALSDQIVQLDELKRDWLVAIQELTDIEKSPDFIAKITALLDQLAVFNLQLPALIKVL